jgi:hypothetical protein
VPKNKKTNEDRQKLYDDSKIESRSIRIAASSPELKGKIRSNITVGDDKVLWYIKFNMALDAESVNRRTMNVTERNGYIVPTEIEYDENRNLISICPTDCYAQNEYYLLFISRKVRGSNGKPLKRQINIMFKLVGNQIAEFRILDPKYILPELRKRPKGYVPQGDVVYPPSVAKAYTFDRKRFDRLPKHKLPMQPFFFNPLVVVAGLGTAVAGLVIENQTVMIVGTVLAILGLLHIGWQFTRPKLRSKMLYNTGVAMFNGGNYKAAKRTFIKAAEVDEFNEYAEYATAKVEFYL